MNLFRSPFEKSGWPFNISLKEIAWIKGLFEVNFVATWYVFLFTKLSSHPWGYVLIKAFICLCKKDIEDGFNESLALWLLHASIYLYGNCSLSFRAKYTDMLFTVDPQSIWNLTKLELSLSGWTRLHLRSGSTDQCRSWLCHTDMLRTLLPHPQGEQLLANTWRGNIFVPHIYSKSCTMLARLHYTVDNVFHNSAHCQPFAASLKSSITYRPVYCRTTWLCLIPCCKSILGNLFVVG